MPQHSSRSPADRPRQRFSAFPGGSANSAGLAALGSERFLDIRPPLWMLAEIPAGLETRMRIECIHACLRRGRIENELSLSALLLHRVVMAHHDGSVGIAVGCQAQPEQTEIDAERKDGCSEDKHNQAEKDLPQPLPELCRCHRHEARL